MLHFQSNCGISFTVDYETRMIATLRVFGKNSCFIEVRKLQKWSLISGLMKDQNRKNHELKNSSCPTLIYNVVERPK